MDDLNEKLTRLLSSPEGMQKIQSAMAALGGMMGDETAATSASPTAVPPATAAAAIPTAAIPTAAPSATAAPLSGGDGGMDMAVLGKILPLLGNLNQENEDTRLLAALRPYLHGQRADRLEESMRLLKLMKLLPLLTEGGRANGG